MVGPSRRSCAALVLLVVTARGGLSLQGASLDASRFEVAYFHPVEGRRVITLFPLISGKALDVELPVAPASVINLISFSSDGRSAYLQIPSAAVLSRTDALFKVEFGPTRQSPVPGSDGLGDISSLTISPRSGRIFVSASGGRDHLCGAYEIDPAIGTHRPLRVGAAPSCGGAMGSISPDGKHVLSTEGQQLRLVDLETGAAQPLGVGRAKWSPDGRRIAVSSQGRVVLIDALNLSQRKKLGSSGVGDNLVWSPDSTQLLFMQQDRRCFLLDDFASLVVLDVETGRRSVVGASRCSVTSSAVGWFDPAVLR